MEMADAPGTDERDPHAVPGRVDATDAGATGEGCVVGGGTVGRPQGITSAKRSPCAGEASPITVRGSVGRRWRAASLRDWRRGLPFEHGARRPRRRALTTHDG